jgi:hypothetical protein
MKKTRLSLAILTSFLVIVLLMESLALVKMADANPFWMWTKIDPLPGAVPPAITIVSPQNNQNYQSDKITIIFNVTCPRLDTNYGKISNVTYLLDSNSTQVMSVWKGNSGSSSLAVPEFNTAFSSPSLSAGNHRLSVCAEGVVFVSPMNIFFIDSVSEVDFTITSQSGDVTPIPTITPTLTATPYLPPNRNAPHLDPIFYLLPISFIVIIIAIALVIFSRRKTFQRIAGKGFES